jgi:pimeloyl-ACP methyl ester carboxylesterase
MSSCRDYLDSFGIDDAGAVTPSFVAVEGIAGHDLTALRIREGGEQRAIAGTSAGQAFPGTNPLYNSRMAVLRAVPFVLVLATLSAQQTISFPTEDRGRVCADLYGEGARAVVLAHGGRFTKESWRVPAQALVSEGFRVLAIDFRGFGCSTGPGQADFDNAPFENDVLAAVRYLKAHGVKTVSVVGGSFGGGAAGDASIKSVPGEIDRIVFLGAAPNLPAEKLKSRALFMVARDDANDGGRRLPGIRTQYENAPQPKELIVLDGSAHAQFLFQTDQSARVMREMLRFLSMP